MQVLAVSKRHNKDWGPILKRAREIVLSYDTDVTLRELFYRLEAEQLLKKSESDINYLSKRVAELRRAGKFPDLVDPLSEIHRPISFGSSREALMWLPEVFRHQRDETQDVSIYIGVEKRAMLGQLSKWFSKYGVGILPLGGNSSQSYVFDVQKDIEAQDRPAALIYMGDLDPSGDFIDVDFVERCGCFDYVKRVGVNVDQIEKFGLVKQDVKRYENGEPKDTKAKRFFRRYGEVFSVELEALEPPVIRSLYEDAFFRFYDRPQYEVALDLEQEDKTELTRMIDRAMREE